MDPRYGNYNEIVEAGFAYFKGEITVGVFEETVNRVLACIRNGQGQFKAIQLSSDLKIELQDDLEKVEKGFSLFEEGLRKIQKFIDEKDRTLLWEGLSLAKVGCDLLNEVIKHYEESTEGHGESNL